MYIQHLRCVSGHVANPCQINLLIPRDPSHLNIMEAIQWGKSHMQKTPLAFKRCWAKLSIIGGILHRNWKIVLPNAEAHPGSGNIRQHAIEIAHEGHQGIGATKRHLRGTLWFPMMDDIVEQLVCSCHPCQATTETKHRNPNIPSEPPSEPRQKPDTNHWGPTPDGKHLLVLIDELSRYPEVMIVNSTGVTDNIETHSTRSFPDMDTVRPSNRIMDPHSMGRKATNCNSTLNGQVYNTGRPRVQRILKQTPKQNPSWNTAKSMAHSHNRKERP